LVLKYLADLKLEDKFKVLAQPLLKRCLKEDETQTVMYLIEQGVPYQLSGLLSSHQGFFLRPHLLKRAILNENEEEVRALLATEGPNAIDAGFINSVIDFETRDSPLFLAIKANKPEMVKLLLEFNPSLDIQNAGGETPLILIERMGEPGRSEILELLIPQKLEQLIKEGDWVGLKDILDRNPALLNSKLKVDGVEETLLTLAIKSEQFLVSCFLITLGVDPRETNSQHKEPSSLVLNIQDKRLKEDIRYVLRAASIVRAPEEYSKIKAGWGGDSKTMLQEAQETIENYKNDFREVASNKKNMPEA
jgi:hypothetical protein